MIYTNGEVIGVLRYVTSLRNADLQVLMIALIAVTVGLLFIGSIFFLSSFFIRSILVPVSQINATAKRIAAGSYGVQIPGQYDDEIGELVSTINDMSVTDETQFNNLFKTCMATADIPTIFMTYGGGNLKSYVDSGLVADLTPYLDADSAWKGTFNSTMFSMLTFEGTDGVYGIPYAAYVDSMFINTKLFEEYGVEIPTTIEELEAACEAFMAAGVTPLPVGDKSTFRGGHLFSLLMAKRTGEDLVKKLASGEVSYDCVDDLQKRFVYQPRCQRDGRQLRRCGNELPVL